ncbi:DUF4811 domain-containing protein [Pediococcus claussenii]|uniref:DUF4811 domain-containing protein n=1 Tax=Pediococcus claussenii (strain ATCC BAA-344 / DSM 14800 / JCM 18046 / KCTC 3811 / LMG 21948 / P06) TaxID=701521 RepID=G8PAT4_PEDCP|nr:DUF4811 domain-containing protein [Pediococcus claussenii]AEV94643.1 hypothetical protein PECL_332 [Pediococcus claussenii ATCC BAA-344]ANZ69846.1 hypothetical protein AYR57_05785 [Pediococcus claussenii]ANZ71663.1 hypothetical protein AYR58_05790 [Pediococcus claussenii]KRN20823.1 hypothetical protein IV79_GL000043 [Pediococcus claussenii]
MLIFISLLCIAGIIFITVNSKITHKILIGSILGMLLLLSQVILIANVNAHWGTEINTSSTSTKIDSIATFPGDNKVLAYRNVGKKRNMHQIYVYKTNSNSNKKSMTYSDGLSVRLIRSKTMTARKIKKVSYYHYKSVFAQFLFAGIQNEHQIKNTTVTFSLPKNWTALSTTQLSKAGQDLKKNQKQLKINMMAKIKAYSITNPKQARNPQALKNVQEKLLQEEVHKTIQRYSNKKIPY